MNINTTKVIVPCRFSYLHCWEPDSVNGGDPKYSVSAIVDKKDTKTVNAIKAAIEQAKQSDTWKEFTHNAAYDERPIPAPGEETVAFCQSEYKDLHDYMVEQGTLVKDYEDLK